MVSKQKETDDRYWSDYTALQHFKHQLLKCYLEGWFPKISKYNPRILYVDTHAGRGKYKTGEEGSPLIALKSLLNHKARDFILKNTEVIFLFLENNPDNAKALKNSLKELTNIPSQISHKVIEEEFSTKLNQGLDELVKGGKKLAPSFFFLDPYNYQLPMELMKKILSNPRSEILINFMTRYVGLAIEKNQEENLNLLFGSNIWKELNKVSDFNERSERLLALYSEELGARYGSILDMKGDKNELKYSLIHATNHKEGRELIKDCLWKVTPDGSFTIYQKKDPKQKLLIQPEPNLNILIDHIKNDFKGKKLRFSQIQDWILESDWRLTHVRTILSKLKDDKLISASDFSGRLYFNEKTNPLIDFHF